ncbi:MAG TPA: YqaA family protein [Woeseiaceae bacterium]|jgi:membrane protein YqaA with SNARE-associated domain
MRIFGRLYDRVLAWARHRYAGYYLAALSFAESSFFPIPPDVMLLPMCLAKRSRAWQYAAITTVMSVLGGIAGYLIGFFVIEAVEPWLRTAGYWPAYLRVHEWFGEWGFWAVIVAGFSPIPYKIFTIAAGAAVLNFPGFVLASALGRAGRFFLVAGLVVLGGEKLEAGLRRYVDIIGWIVAVAAVLLALVYLLGN